MVSAFWCLSLSSLLGFVVRRMRTTDRSRGASEETAHAAALLKRTEVLGATHPERRSERRHKTALDATAKILGVEESEAPCHIVNICSSGMRITLSAPVLPGAQVQVQWGDHFFVGARRNQSFSDGKYSIGLQLISCNYIRVPWRWRLWRWRLQGSFQR
jgi:hypothetical protein